MTKTGMTSNPPLLFPMFDEHGDLHHHIEAHTSHFNHACQWRPYPIEDIDDDPIFEDAKDELDDDDDTTLADLDDSIDQYVYQSNFHCLVCNVDSTVLEDELISHGPKKIAPSDQDYGALKPWFAWLPVKIIKKTFSETTQYAQLPFNTILWKQYKSPNPALNIGSTMSLLPLIQFSQMPQLSMEGRCMCRFLWYTILIMDVYGMKSLAQFPNTLSNNIREYGTPRKLISDHAQVEISKHMQEIL